MSTINTFLVPRTFLEALWLQQEDNGYLCLVVFCDFVFIVLSLVESLSLSPSSTPSPRLVQVSIKVDGRHRGEPTAYILPVMNCPSPVHHPEGDGMNQNPNALSPALTTNEDLNGMANLKVLKRLASTERITEDEPFDESDAHRDKTAVATQGEAQESQESENELPGPGPGGNRSRISAAPTKLLDIVITFGKFVGPGFMVRCGLPEIKILNLLAYDY